MVDCWRVQFDTLFWGKIVKRFPTCRIALWAPVKKQKTSKSRLREKKLRPGFLRVVIVAITVGCPGRILKKKRKNPLNYERITRWFQFPSTQVEAIQLLARREKEKFCLIVRTAVRHAQIWKLKTSLANKWSHLVSKIWNVWFVKLLTKVLSVQ